MYITYTNSSLINLLYTFTKTMKHLGKPNLGIWLDFTKKQSWRQGFLPELE